MGQLIVKMFEGNEFVAVTLLVLVAIVTWFFKDISSLQMLRAFSGRYRKRLKRELAEDFASPEYHRFVEFELERRSVRKRIGISNYHIQREILNIVMDSKDLIDVKFFKQFNFILSVHDDRAIIDPVKIKQRRKESIIICLFSFILWAIGFSIIKSEPYLGLAFILNWIILFMVGLFAFPPPKSICLRAIGYLDNYYTRQTSSPNKGSMTAK